MRKSMKWLLAIVGIIIASIIIISIWQKENIQAISLAITKSNEVIKGEISSIKQEGEKILKSYQIEDVRDFTLEEEEEIRRGEVSTEEAIQKIRREALPHVNEKEMEVKEEAKAKQLISEATTAMYGLKAKYIGALGELERRGIQELKLLPKEERTMKGIKKLAPTYISQGYTLEKRCNAEVNDVLNNLEKELKISNEDTHIVSVMRDTYNSEKAHKKAYYLSLLID